MGSYKALGETISTTPQYAIGDVTEMTGISAFTLRYYDKCGFFPNLMRDRRGVRSFSDADIAQLRLIDALRRSGLSIEGIQYFVRLQNAKRDTTDELQAILDKQRTVLEYQAEEVARGLGVLDSSIQALSSKTHPRKNLRKIS